VGQFWPWYFFSSGPTNKAALLAGFEEGARLVAEHHAVGALFDFDGRPVDVGMLANATISDP